MDDVHKEWADLDEWIQEALMKNMDVAHTMMMKYIGYEETYKCD